MRPANPSETKLLTISVVGSFICGVSLYALGGCYGDGCFANDILKFFFMLPAVVFFLGVPGRRRLEALGSFSLGGSNTVSHNCALNCGEGSMALTARSTPLTLFAGHANRCALVVPVSVKR